ncbi:hypothetical protein ACSBR2_015253 [Camellia fascicularis]
MCEDPDVQDWYLHSFRDLRRFPEIMDTNDELEFTQMLKIIKVRHNNIVPIMALGVQQLKKSLDPKINDEDLDEIQQFLDCFYMSRIGIRILIDYDIVVLLKFGFTIAILHQPLEMLN